MADNDRIRVEAWTPEETAAALADLIGRTGGESFEIAYDRADGPPLRHGEEPAPGERVRWTATAVYPHGTYVGEHVLSEGHGAGLALACADLARELGANVTVLDAR